MDAMRLILIWIAASLAVGALAGIAYYGAGLVMANLGLRLGAGSQWALTGAWVTGIAAVAVFAVALLAGEQTFARLPCLEGGETLPSLSVWGTEWAVWLIGTVIFVASVITAGLRRQLYVVTVGAVLAGALVGGFEIGRGWAPRTCPVGPTDVYEPAHVTFAFSEPYPGTVPTSGPSSCHRAEPNAQVDWIETSSDPFLSTWLFGTSPTRQVKLTFDPTGDFLKVDLVDLVAHKPAVYGALLGGTTRVGSIDRAGSADGSTGQIVFADLAHVPDEAFDPNIWPETISGEVSWSCGGS